jgi:hypothetical protein
VANSLEILQREGEHDAEAHHENPADFDEHIEFYRGALRVTRIFLTFIALLLISLYFFLVH